MRTCADTIGDISARAAWGKVPPPPRSVEDALDAIRFDLQAKLAHVQAKQARSPALGAFSRRVRKAQNKIQDFERIIAEERPGFRLALVYYEPPVRQEYGQRDPVMREYDRKAKHRALVNAGESHEKELRDFGICDHGISMMKRGHHPMNRDGFSYDADFDHVFEQSRGARLRYAQVKDPDYKNPDAGPVYPINAVGNQIFMAGHTHRDKNALMSMQKPGWNVSIVPVRDAKHSGVVSAPQNKPVSLRAHSPMRCISRMIFWAKRTLDAAWHLKQDVEAQPLLKAFGKAAKREKKTPAELATAFPQNTNIVSLIDIFAATFDGRIRGASETTVRPALREIGSQLAHIADEVIERDLWNRRNDKQFAVFADTWYSKRMTALRTVTAGLPFREAGELQRTFAQVDARMEKADAARAVIARQKQAMWAEKSTYKTQAREQRLGRAS